MRPTPPRKLASLRFLPALLWLCGAAVPLGCGSEPASLGDGRVAAAEASGPHASAREEFFVRLDWQTPTHERVATQCASAHLWFFNDAQELVPRPPVKVESLKVIMPCCASQPATKPRWELAADLPHLLEVVDICPSRSGRWELRLTALFDDGTTDDSVISFVAP